MKVVTEESEASSKGITAKDVLEIMRPKAAPLFPELADPTDVKEIGRLYRQAKIALVDSVKWLIECGKRLKAQKDKLNHGEWLPWLEANKEELGFGARTAAYLMDAASRPFSINRKLELPIWTEAEARDISRQIWGHREPEPTTDLDDSEVSQDDLEEPPEPPEPEPAPKEKKPPSYKPIDVSELKPFDVLNSRRCTASCCQPDSLDVVGVWALHDAQSVFDREGFSFNFFGEYHNRLLKILVEVYHQREVERLANRKWFDPALPRALRNWSNDKS